MSNVNAPSPAVAAIAAAWAAFTRIDLRSWFTVALFALVWRIIELVAAKPALLQDSSFMQLITPIAGAGGLLLVASFLFASNKEGADKSTALRENAVLMREAGIPVGRRADDPPPDPGGDPAASDVGTMEVHAETVNVRKP